MKFLFIVQGEGRGHLTQALTLEERLRESGHEVVEVLVGKSRYRRLPDFFCRKIGTKIAQFESPNFLPTPANRRNNITGSVIYNLLRLPVFVRSVLFLRRKIRESNADVVVNFYELLTGVTYLLFRLQVRQVCIGHQYLFLHSKFCFPKTKFWEITLLKMFTRLTAIGADRKFALSFIRMDDDERHGISVVPPLLRKEVLKLRPSSGDYVLGYMVNSGFASQVNEWHNVHCDIPLRFFWDKKGETEVRHIDDTLSYYPLDDKAFLQQMASCKAYASTAGFESICEAMYLGKPVLMVPAHIEQECNAYDAMMAGAGIVADGFDLGGLVDFSKRYEANGTFVFWSNNTHIIVNRLIAEKEKVEHAPYAIALLWQRIISTI